MDDRIFFPSNVVVVFVLLLLRSPIVTALSLKYNQQKKNPVSSLSLTSAGFEFLVPNPRSNVLDSNFPETRRKKIKRISQRTLRFIFRFVVAPFCSVCIIIATHAHTRSNVLIFFSFTSCSCSSSTCLFAYLDRFSLNCSFFHIYTVSA